MTELEECAQSLELLAGGDRCDTPALAVRAEIIDRDARNAPTAKLFLQFFGEELVLPELLRPELSRLAVCINRSQASFTGTDCALAPASQSRINRCAASSSWDLATS